MQARQQVAVMVAIVATTLVSGNAAHAQGTVSWSQGYPVINQPPFPGATGSVDVLGTYTAAPAGWTVTGAAFQWVPVNGGTLQGSSLAFQNGQMGALQNGQIVAARVSPIQRGTYNGWLSVLYVSNQPGVQPQAALSAQVQFTIN